MLLSSVEFLFVFMPFALFGVFVTALWILWLLLVGEIQKNLGYKLADPITGLFDTLRHLKDAGQKACSALVGDEPAACRPAKQTKKTTP